MIILSWNARGIGAKVKKSLIRNLIRKHEPFFVFIQESKTETCSQKIINSIWNIPTIGWCASPSLGLSGGILSMWNNSHFKIEVYKIHQRWIAISENIIPSSFECSLINIYNSCNVDGRKVVWHEIDEFQKLSKRPCLIMGDFNETLSQSDRGSQWINPQGSKDFLDFINSLSLLEITPQNDGYTWIHGPSKSKLDRLFVTSEWLIPFPELKTMLLNRSVSDHKPLLASSFEQNWGPRPFRSINCWFTNPKCLDVIKKSWSDSKSLAPTLDSKRSEIPFGTGTSLTLVSLKPQLLAWKKKLKNSTSLQTPVPWMILNYLRENIVTLSCGNVSKTKNPFGLKNHESNG